MQSSRAYAVSNLELPAVTAAGGAGGVLALLASAFLAWTGLRGGIAGGVAGTVVLAGTAYVACLLGQWRRACSAPARQLEARPDGSIWLLEAGAAPVAMAIGRGTRLLGPSVFLDLRVADPRSTARLRCWITPLDAPGHVVRQWSVVLPRGGRVART